MIICRTKKGSLLATFANDESMDAETPSCRFPITILVEIKVLMAILSTSLSRHSI